MILPIFIPHAGCPHLCSFCNQRTISGEGTAAWPEPGGRWKTSLAGSVPIPPTNWLFTAALSLPWILTGRRPCWTCPRCGWCRPKRQGGEELELTFELAYSGEEGEQRFVTLWALNF